MAAPKNLIADEEVAELLKREARHGSISKRPAKKLRPNTRFLSRLVTEAKNHNDSLAPVDKEAPEDRRRREEKAGRKHSASLLAHSSKNRNNKAAKMDGDSHRITKSGYSRADSPPLPARDSQEAVPHGHPKRRRSPSDDRQDHQSKQKYRKRHREDHQEKERGRPRRRPTSSSMEAEYLHRLRTSHLERRRRINSARPCIPEDIPGEEEEEDDLPCGSSSEDAFGPQPASGTAPGQPPPPRRCTQARGRGARSGRALSGTRSDMDRRFAPDYDPAADVEPNERADGDDDRWNREVAEYRARRGQQPNGPSSHQSRPPPRRGMDGDVSSVRWNKQGEKRAWDRGKEVDTDGSVIIRPSWVAEKPR